MGLKLGRHGDFYEWLFYKGGMKRSLLFPFLAIIFLGIGTIWFIDRTVSRRTLGSAMDELLLETAEGLQFRAVSYIDGAILLAESNASMALSAQASATLDGFRLTLWRQLKGRRDVDLACIAFSNGEYIEAQRLGDRVRTGQSGKATGGALVLESVDEDGRPSGVELRREAYDPRKRPWYLAAQGAGHATWTPPYSLVSSGEMAMAAAVPFYDEKGLAGVTTVDIRMGAVSGFLAEASSVSGSLCFILDDKGKLIASSISLPLEGLIGGRKPQAPAALVAAAAGGANGWIKRIKENGRAWRLTSLDLTGKAGLPWLLVTAFPEDPFLSRLAQADSYSLAILLLVLATTLGFGFSAAHRVSRPLRRLGLLAEAFDPDAPGLDMGLEEESRREDEIGRLALAFDRMSRRLAESFSSLHDSIEEKEVLLKELNHRVKNNLQIVSSLVSSQAYSITDEETRKGLESLQDRIQAMAYVHEDVFHSGDMGSVDMDRYLSRISEALVTGCVAVDGRRAGTCPVSLEVVPGGVFLSMDKALPCGLIVNELVSNCLRHAFPGREEGRVRVALADQGDSGYLLTVTDDGIGLEAGKAASSSRREGMGSSLVEALTAQLGGKMTVSSSPGGTVHSLGFPKRPKA